MRGKDIFSSSTSAPSPRPGSLVPSLLLRPPDTRWGGAAQPSTPTGVQSKTRLKPHVRVPGWHTATRAPPQNTSLGPLRCSGEKKISFGLGRTWEGSIALGSRSAIGVTAEQKHPKAASTEARTSRALERRVKRSSKEPSPAPRGSSGDVPSPRPWGSGGEVSARGSSLPITNNYPPVAVDPGPVSGCQLARWSPATAGWWGFNDLIDLPDGPTRCARRAGARGEQRAEPSPSPGGDLGAPGDRQEQGGGGGGRESISGGTQFNAIKKREKRRCKGALLKQGIA